MITRKLGNWKQPLRFWRHPINFFRHLLSSFKNLKWVPHPLPKWLIWLPASVGGLLAVWMLAFTFDAYVFMDKNDAARNIELVNLEMTTGKTATYDVGGMNLAELEQLLAEISATKTWQSVELIFPTEAQVENIKVSAPDLGVQLNVEASANSILEKRKGQNFFSRLIGWSKSFLSADTVSIQYEVVLESNATLQANISGLPNLPISLVDARSANFQQNAPSLPLVLLPETIGSEISAESFHNAGYELVDSGFPSRVAVNPVEVFPQVRNREMDSLVRETNAQTAVGLDIVVSGEIRRMSVETYRSVFIYGRNPVTQLLTRQIDVATLQREIELLFVDFVLEAARPVFTINDAGIPVYEIEGANVGCCQPIGSTQIERLLIGEAFIELEPIELEDDAIVNFDNLGIVEIVGSFATTKHFNEARVQNIETAAEALRGVVILPGDFWSLNPHLGERTEEKGYVLASHPVPYGTTLQIGGGIEQLSSTLFNAALLAGLNIPIRQSLPDADDTYPYGRDAQLGWPNPGMVISNPTPYGMLIWPRIDEGTVTVDLYSTRYYNEVVIDRPDTHLNAGCASVTLDRTKTDLQGRERTDTFYSYYFSSFGLVCNAGGGEENGDGESTGENADSAGGEEGAGAENIGAENTGEDAG